MDIIKRIKQYLLLQVVFLSAAACAAMWFGPSALFLPAGLAFEGALTGWAAWKILNPLSRFQKIIEACLSGSDCREKLKEASQELALMGKIRNLLDVCAQEMTRKNSAAIFHKHAELTALQSQINPHFLYNTLESVRGQALLDGNEEIARMMEALSSFFRYSISRKGTLVTLRDELANIQNYMLIQRYRFNNRFSMEIYIDEEDEDAYDFKIPKLIIQPVVENAVFHGLEERLEGGTVSIEVIVTDKHMMITVSDNGKGMDDETLARLNKRIHSQEDKLVEEDEREQTNTGIGLPNIHKRLQLLFGEEYGLSVYSTLNQGTDVEITVPTINCLY